MINTIKGILEALLDKLDSKILDKIVRTNIVKAYSY